jgi:hypothetical protein
MIFGRIDAGVQFSYPPACEGYMLHQESSSRELVWNEGQNVEGWGCCECAWVFNPSGPPAGESLDEMKRTFKMQLSEEFASHACAKHSRVKAARRRA